ncbi:MAG: hypothetical protein JXA67_14150 [Micromonosporaceae bacterium]|nr:hypothetical protein [Micromonosporaceae bacterium]
MTTDQDEVHAERENVDLARQRLSDDASALANEANPSAIARRTTQRIGRMITEVKDKMTQKASEGTAEGATQMRSAMDLATATAASTPRKVRRWARENPLAVGLIAFGVGWLVRSITPVSPAEHRAADRITDIAHRAVH